MFQLGYLTPVTTVRIARGDRPKRGIRILIADARYGCSGSEPVFSLAPGSRHSGSAPDSGPSQRPFRGESCPCLLSIAPSSPGRICGGLDGIGRRSPRSSSRRKRKRILSTLDSDIRVTTWNCSCPTKPSPKPKPKLVAFAQRPDDIVVLQEIYNEDLSNFPGATSH